MAKLLRNPATLWDPHDRPSAQIEEELLIFIDKQTEELLICIDALRGELIAWAEGR